MQKTSVVPQDIELALPSVDDPLFRDGMDIYEREMHRFRRAFAATGQPSGQAVLDIGAYPGTAFKVFGKNNNYTSFGLTMTDRYRAFLSEAHIPHIDGNIETYSTPSNADIILFMEIIEHLRRPYTALRNLWNIAKRDARIYVTTNNASYYGYILKLLFNRDIYDSITMETASYPGHTRYYGLAELATEMQRIGFQIESRRYVNLLPATRYYRNRLFGGMKNWMGACLPARYASHIEIVARK